MKVICNSDCRHTSLEEGECQKLKYSTDKTILMFWTEHEDKGKKFPCVVCDDYEPIKKETK